MAVNTITTNVDVAGPEISIDITGLPELLAPVFKVIATDADLTEDLRQSLLDRMYAALRGPPK
jgi:hypothetical protein